MVQCQVHPEIDDSWVCKRCNWRSFEPNTNPNFRPSQCLLMQDAKGSCCARLMNASRISRRGSLLLLTGLTKSRQIR